MAGVETWTGDRPLSCPWRAFYDPFVKRVLRAHWWAEQGQLTVREPDPSYRLLEGVEHYARALAAVEYHQIKEEQANAAARAEAR